MSGASLVRASKSLSRVYSPITLAHRGLKELAYANFICDIRYGYRVASCAHHTPTRCIHIDDPEKYGRPEKDIQTVDYGNIGEEIVGKKIDKHSALKLINQFIQNQPIRELAQGHGMDDRLFLKAAMSFRRFCIKSESLPPELHVKLCDIIDGHGHVSDLFPDFLKHARHIFPHLECREELKKISDLTIPPNWYPEARGMNRKVIFHSGPTNSGKTYRALNRFLQSKSGIYCGPLKMLAAEVYHKSNEYGTKCDLITGEERKYANPDSTPSNHTALTVEMVPVNRPVEVAVIDEIQMMRDEGRGWAWTRALLGVPAGEIHLCGEEAAVDLVREILLSTGEELVVERYDRLTGDLCIEKDALESLNNVRPGDCIVCFSKEHIYQVSMGLEQRGFQVAVIYGTLPPGTKLSQCSKFNNPEDKCNVLVATDAIGMGLNLSIRRIIFWTLMKPSTDKNGNKNLEYLTTSQCKQIAGRAGRFGSMFKQGYVTTFKKEDLRQLREIMSKPINPIEKAGLQPTAEQIELFAYHLKHLSLSNLIDLFIDLCEVDSNHYFICNMDNFKILADLINHIPIDLRARYVFCCAPLNTKLSFEVAMFVKFARQFSMSEPITLDWICDQIGWPLKKPKNVVELTHLEAVFDVFELYLWLSYRFFDMFPDADGVRELQSDLEMDIDGGVSNIVQLFKSTKGRSALIDSKINSASNIA
ncbi:ATP-dependent RNA helicase SUPV3L1, mitochondrial, partial [Fragariocoptes setiger]